ncbi:alpha/beta hydrolase [Chryseobacterium sp. FH2]|uniref:alpha/beta hydrolase n=1 Tax=Chryseobacterium sp. FH2 TaxID=1674291 RepID=UPI00065AFEA8|nr:alpha/beta hydrolase-fold protein [Chryseobacterium sp. FH2]
MSNLFKTIIFILCIILSSICNAQNQIVLGEKQEVFSKILNEKREILIHLPKNYNDPGIKPAKYPVIYLLDAEINFEYYAPMTDFLSKQPYADIPEFIVIAIKNTDRTRDLTPTKSSKKSPVNPSQVLFENSGGSENFIKFIQEELKPFVNKTYRTANYSILVGHSFGGLFTVNTLLAHPDYFNAYVANDPSLWWDDKVLISKTKNYITKNKKFPENKFLYIAQANNEEQNKNWNSDMGDAIQEFKNLVEVDKTLNFKHRFYEDEIHGNVSYPANYDALKFIFKGFKTDIKKLSEAPENLENNYKKFSGNIGTEFIPSEAYLNVIISFMNKNQFGKSEKFFIDLKNKLYKN